MNKYIKAIVDMSQNEKYTRIYMNIVNSALERIPIDTSKSIYANKYAVNKNKGKYVYEAHHILPRKLCQNEIEINDTNNICFLTLKEHLFCHKILALRIIPNTKAAVKAYYAIFQKRTPEQIYRLMTTSELLYFRKQYHIFGNKGSKNGMFGKKHTTETRAKIGAKSKGRKKSQEVRMKHSIRMKALHGNAWYQIKESSPNIDASSYDDLIEKIGTIYRMQIQNTAIISSKLHVSQGVVCSVLKLLNIKLDPVWAKMCRNYPNRWNNYKEFQNLVYDMYMKQVTPCTIAKILETNTWCIYSALKRLNIMLPKTDPYWTRILNKNPDFRFKTRDEMNVYIKNAIRSGQSLRDISKELSIGIDCVKTAILS